MDINRDYVQMWDKRRSRNQLVREAKQIMLMRVASRIHVIAPYDPLFAHRAAAFGRWRKRSQVWSFPDRRLAELKALITETYGVVVLKVPCVIDLPA